MENPPPTRKIKVTPYDPKWPKQFEDEASQIKEALEENFWFF